VDEMETNQVEGTFVKDVVGTTVKGPSYGFAGGGSGGNEEGHGEELDTMMEGV
jgi:hypothetical protein